MAGTLVSKNLVGRCGLYCGFCLIYRAGKDSEKLRKSVARRSKCKPEDIRCEGCQTVLVDGWDNARWGKNCKIIKCQEAKVSGSVTSVACILTVRGFIRLLITL